MHVCDHVDQPIGSKDAATHLNCHCIMLCINNPTFRDPTTKAYLTRLSGRWMIFLAQQISRVHTASFSGCPLWIRITPLPFRFRFRSL